jgi:hypothetical protein
MKRENKFHGAVLNLMRSFVVDLVRGEQRKEGGRREKGEVERREKGERKEYGKKKEKTEGKELEGKEEEG